MSKWYVLGAGRVGKTFGELLFQKGSLGGAWTRSKAKIAPLQKAWPNVDLSSLPPQNIDLSSVDVILVALPDSIFSRFLPFIDPVYRADPKKKWIHLSGAMPASSLTKTGIQGQVASAHPLHAFAGSENDISALKGAFFAIDGEDKALEKAKWLVKIAGGQAHFLPSKARPAYHLAAVLASNGIYAIAQAANTLASAQGFQSKSLEKGLAHLMIASAKLIATHGVKDAATGPVVRGDVNTVEQHMKVVQKNAEIENIYQELSQWLLKIAQQREISQSNILGMQVALFGKK